MLIKAERVVFVINENEYKNEGSIKIRILSMPSSLALTIQYMIVFI